MHCASSEIGLQVHALGPRLPKTVTYDMIFHYTHERILTALDQEVVDDQIPM